MRWYIVFRNFSIGPFADRDVAEWNWRVRFHKRGVVVAR